MSSKGPTCPICGDATAVQFRPFCSRRCADVDLARWLRGAYAIPVVDADDDEDGVAKQKSIQKMMGTNMMHQVRAT